MKKIIIHCVAVVIVVLGGWGCSKAQNNLVVEKPVSEQNVEPVTELRIEVKEEGFVSDENRIVMEVHYPSFGIDSVDQVIAKKVQETIEIEKKELSELILEADQTGDTVVSENGLSFRVDYKVIRSDKDGIDVLLTFSDYRGGPHDSLWLETFMFDPKTGQQIDPLSLFGSDEAAVLQKLSADARARLPEMLMMEPDDIMLEDGTEPKRENFMNILRTSDHEAVIYFEPYAVAPWAAGVVLLPVQY